MGWWKTTKRNLMLNCEWCHFQRIFVWEIGNTLTPLEDLDLKNWCHWGRWVIEQVIPKKNRRLFLNECHFGSMSNFGIRAFHFFFGKNLVPDHWSFDKRHRVFGVIKNSQFHLSSVSIESRVHWGEVALELLSSRRTISIQKHDGCWWPTAEWNYDVTWGLGEPFRPRCNPGGDEKWWDHEQMKQSVPPVCEEKEQDWGGHLRVFFWVCVFIF